MSYGIIRAKITKQYESTRYDFRFCKSVKILYSGCKETVQSSCKLGAGYFPIFMNKMEKSIKTS